MIGRCPVPRAVPVPISLTAYAHLVLVWVRYFIEPDILKTCTVRQYHSDLSYQSALEIRVRNLGYTQNCNILALFTGNKESEHLIFREFHGR